MDLGSLDFETWRLVGLGLLALGALAAVLAIVAIIIMFRSGSTYDDRRHVEAVWDVDADADADADEDDDDDDDEEDDPREARRTSVAAAARGMDSGPTSMPVGLSGPQDDLFTVPAYPSPRKPMPATLDEPHVPSPDWYTYPDVVAEPAGGGGDDVIATYGGTRQADQPSTPPASAPTDVAQEQSVAPVRPAPRRPTSRWFDDASSSDTGANPVPPTLSARHADTQSAPAAAVPVLFPWEQRPETTTQAPEQPVAPAAQEPKQPAASTVEVEPKATSRHSDAHPAEPTPPARQEPQPPTAERHGERGDTGTVVGVTGATSQHAGSRTAAASPPEPTEREVSDLPAADWYDDPDGSGGERWWDGKAWTRRRRPRAGSPSMTDTGQQRAIARPRAATPTDTGSQPTAPAADDDAQGEQSSSRPPGWYRDPSGSGGRRFWDGSGWTNGT